MQCFLKKQKNEEYPHRIHNAWYRIPHKSRGEPPRDSLGKESWLQVGSSSMAVFTGAFPMESDEFSEKPGERDSVLESGTVEGKRKEASL